jgi:hypothetical protein
MCGIGSETLESIVTWALRGSTLIAERITTVPRSKERRHRAGPRPRRRSLAAVPWRRGRGRRE